MAVIPGTKYAEGTLPGRTGQQPMSAPQDNGQQIASAVGQLGGAIMDYALDVQKKKIDAEKSRKKREIDEAGWAASEAITGDEKADKKILEKFQQDTQRIANSSEYKDVNDETQQHLNSVVPNWAHTFRVKSLGIQEREASDQLELEWSKSLEYGDIEGANKIAENALKSKAITQAKYDDKIKRAPAESHILIANRLLDNANQSEGKKDYQAVLDELDKTNEMDLDPKQRQNRQTLKLTAERAKGELDETTINTELDKVRKGVPVKDIVDSVMTNPNLDGSQATELANKVLKSAEIFQKTGNNPFTVRQNEKVYADTLIKLTNNPESVSDKEIQDGIGIKWTTTDYQHLWNLKHPKEGAFSWSDPVNKAWYNQFSLAAGAEKLENGDYVWKLPPDKIVEWSHNEEYLVKLLSDKKYAEAKTFIDGLTKKTKDEKARDWLKWLNPLTYSPLYNVGKIISTQGKINELKAKKVESKYEIGQVVTLKDGTKYKITGFDDDGTPRGDPVK
jgi:hypothetical protein